MPLQAELGQPYNLLSFQPYLERGYNTLLGWQGWPVSPDDPHLYRYTPHWAPFAEVEFSHVGGQIQAQTLKLSQPKGKLTPQGQQELLWFALEASRRSLHPDQLNRLLNSPCEGIWQMGNYQLSFLMDHEAHYLKVAQASSSPSSVARPLSACQGPAKSVPAQKSPPKSSQQIPK